MRREFFKNFYEVKKKCEYSFITGNIKDISLGKYNGDKEKNFYESEPLARFVYITFHDSVKLSIFENFKKRCLFSDNFYLLYTKDWNQFEDVKYYESVKPISKLDSYNHGALDIFSYFYFKIPLIGKNMIKDKDKMPDVIFEFDQ
jgi:hypothetical protein